MTPEAKRFIFTTLGISIVVFNITFQLGAFGEIFYQNYLLIWVISTVVLLANFAVKKENKFIGRLGMVALLGPSVLLGVFAFFPADASGWTFTRLLLLAGGAIIFFVSLPYVVYTIVRVTQSDPEGVFYKRRHVVAATFITLFIGVSGLLIGIFHPAFFDCNSFLKAGDFVPPNCTELQP